MDPAVAFSTAMPIDGVALYPLKEIGDERGAVLHMLRADLPGFRGFGEVYFSEVRPGVVKAWKRHARMTQRLAVPVGRVKFVIYDAREGSPTRGALAEHVVGRPNAYRLLVIPPGVWYGFQGIAAGPSLIANCTDLPHDPAESESRPANDGPVAYAW